MGKGSVVVIAHNSGGHIEACLESVCDQPGWEVILVDNASTDDTLSRARRFTRKAVLIANAENRGFAGAVNQAASRASGNVLIVLNPDAVAAPGALDHLAEALAPAGVAAAGGLLVGAEGVQCGFVVRRFPRLVDAACEVLLVNVIWPGNPCNRRYRCMDLDLSRVQDVEQPAGAALAFRRDVWQEVEGFDERFYPVWYEDVDFCLRLRRRGWKIRYQPAAVFQHRGGHSVSQMTFAHRQLFWYANLLRYFQKHHGAASSYLLRAAVLAGMGMRSLACLMAFGPRGVRAREALRAYGAVAKYCVRNRNQQPSRERAVALAKQEDAFKGVGPS